MLAINFLVNRINCFFEVFVERSLYLNRLELAVSAYIPHSSRPATNTADPRHAHFVHSFTYVSLPDQLAESIRKVERDDVAIKDNHLIGGMNKPRKR